MQVHGKFLKSSGKLPGKFMDSSWKPAGKFLESERNVPERSWKGSGKFVETSCGRESLGPRRPTSTNRSLCFTKRMLHQNPAPTQGLPPSRTLLVDQLPYSGLLTCGNQVESRRRCVRCANNKSWWPTFMVTPEGPLGLGLLPSPVTL